jgi:hypothetical protein
VPNDQGLPNWFPDDFAADDEITTALEGDQDEDWGPQVEQYANSGLISDQLKLAEAGDGEGILGQLIELAGNEAWRREHRGPHGQWTGGSGGSAAFRRSATPPAMARVTQRRAAANRAQAQQAVADRLAEEHARKALEDAKAEVERVTTQLRQEATSEEERKHRVKLAVHAVLIIGGAILAAILAGIGAAPVLAAFAAAGPLLATELTDWRKKL